MCGCQTWIEPATNEPTNQQCEQAGPSIIGIPIAPQQANSASPRHFAAIVAFIAGYMGR
jgi:hypothetical protein